MMRWMICVLGTLLPVYVLADVQINVVGLFSGKAVLVINGGRPVTLAVGQRGPEGVTLLAADSQRAVLDVQGRRRELGMGQAVSVLNPTSATQSLTLYANAAGHHFVDASVNGVALKAIVDTGATSVVLNSGDARYASLDYKHGERRLLQTAAGIVEAYRVTLNTLRLGSNITLHQVEGMVIEGGSPPVMLLGMSALQRLEMKHNGNALTLTKKY